MRYTFNSPGVSARNISITNLLNTIFLGGKVQHTYSEIYNTWHIIKLIMTPEDQIELVELNKLYKLRYRP